MITLVARSGVERTPFVGGGERKVDLLLVPTNSARGEMIQDRLKRRHNKSRLVLEEGRDERRPKPRHREHRKNTFIQDMSQLIDSNTESRDCRD